MSSGNKFGRNCFRTVKERSQFWFVFVWFILVKRKLGKRKTFWKSDRVTFLRCPRARKFQWNSSIWLGYRDTSNVVFFFALLSKIFKFKIVAIFGKRKFFRILDRVSCSDNLTGENFDNATQSHTVEEI